MLWGAWVWWNKCLAGYFHVTLLCFVRFGTVFCHVGRSEFRESGEVAVADCSEQYGFGGKPKHGMEVLSHVCS